MYCNSLPLPRGKVLVSKSVYGQPGFVSRDARSAILWRAERERERDTNPVLSQTSRGKTVDVYYTRCSFTRAEFRMYNKVNHNTAAATTLWAMLLLL